MKNEIDKIQEKNLIGRGKRGEVCISDIINFCLGSDLPKNNQIQE